MAKAEISWNRVSEDGVKRQAYAHHVGDRWIFFQRVKRFDEWEENKEPAFDVWNCWTACVAASTAASCGRRRRPAW